MITGRTAPPRILLLGGDVRSNLGDRAIRSALLEMIREAAPGAECYALSRQPARDRREFGMRVAGSNRLGLFARSRLLRRMDLVVWGGGQLLQDDTSLLKNLYWAAALSWIHRVLRRPVIALGIGIGPLSRPLGRLFARGALRNLSECVGRDRETCEWVERLTRGRVPVRQAVDAAFFLRSPVSGGHGAGEEERVPGETVVGISVRRWFHLGKNPVLPYQWKARPRAARSRENDRMERLVRELGSALNRLGADRKIRLLFFPMASMEWEGEAGLCRQVAAAAGQPARILSLDGAASEAMIRAASCDLFVTMRMHGAVLAAAMGTPAITLSPSAKSAHFLRLMGMEDGALDLETVASPGGAGVLYARMRRALDAREALAARLHRRRRELQADREIYRSAVQRGLER